MEQSVPRQHKAFLLMENKENNDIVKRERAAREEMKKKIRLSEEREAVQKMLSPYMRGGEFVTQNSPTRCTIRIPLALQPIAGQQKVTSSTTDGVYHRTYELLIGKKTTLQAVFDAAMKEREEDGIVTDSTLTRDRQIWKKYFEGKSLAQKPISGIKASEIQRYLKKITARCAMSHTTYINVKSLLNLAYDYAIDHDMLENNTSRQCRLKDVKFKPAKGGTYTDSERLAILKYIKEAGKIKASVYYAAIYVMFGTCTRIGEIKALKWGDYDPEEGTLFIHAEVVPRDGKPVYLDHTKSSEYGNRVQYLSPDVCKLLDEMRPANASEDDFIFKTESGGYLNTNKFNDRLKNACEHAGVPYQSSHKIRFWSVTAMARELNGDIAATGNYAGHAHKQTTLGYIRYLHNENAQKNAAKNAFAVVDNPQ